MWYIVVFGVGVFVGFLLCAIMTVSGNCSKIEDAYYQGYRDGEAKSKGQ